MRLNKNVTTMMMTVMTTYKTLNWNMFEFDWIVFRILETVAPSNDSTYNVGTDAP
jgi:hypothetical protein